MKKLTKFALVLTTATLPLLMVSPASAEQGDLLVRTTVIGVFIDAQSDALDLDVENTIDVALDISYFFTPNIAVDVLATFLNTEVSAGGLGSLGSVDLLPPIVTVQYHFAPDAQIRPYVGVGFNYNVFSNESGTLDAINTDIDDTVGFVAQVGVDYMLNKSLSLNADFKYLALTTDVNTDLGNDELDLDTFILGIGIGYRF